ncbi:DUF4189 domain-containing protein [Nocardia brasiliensis]|uniref:DUF4189 domain-containing protein n=1 Tax=Nocardia brasiliensis TaxID=37326 RepID=A0A6G9XTD3_NOCBR|nr:DUF4189 domain-containing protein [Nocardia brasiliensis]QIS04166.1 DUF4189 domain-containing protein [Nocardia brasiliensis]
MTVSSKFAAAVVATVTALTLVGTGAGPAAATEDLYGAIAITGMKVGEATDYPTRYEADQAALAACGAGVCHIVARVHNECGAVVELDGRTPFQTSPSYFSATGRTAAEAEANALRLAPNTGTGTGTGLMEIVQPPFVLGTVCTSNAGWVPAA